jgi:hypothetical protein
MKKKKKKVARIVRRKRIGSTSGGNSALAYGLLTLGLLVVGYAVTRPTVPPAYTQIPPGGTIGGYVNQSNEVLIVNAIGQIITAAGQVIGVLNDAGVFEPKNDSNANPSAFLVKKF